MSDLIPQRTIDAYRNFNDTAVGLYGIACTLYIPSNIASIDLGDPYVKPADYTYTTYTDQKVWIEWAPEAKRLRQLGVFAEDETPIIAWFKFEPKITIRSYIQVTFQYEVDETYDTTQFEVVEMIMNKMHDAELFRCVKLAPRRVK